MSWHSVNWVYIGTQVAWKLLTIHHIFVLPSYGCRMCENFNFNGNSKNCHACFLNWMQRLLKIYNKKESLNKENLPESNNRSFSLNSSIKGIHIGRAKPKLRHSMIDQAFLERIIEEWRKGNNKISAHFRPKVSDVEKQN